MAKEPNKLFVNFFGMESIYHRCKLTFLFKSLIYKHLKSNCIRQNQENNTALSLVPIFFSVIKFTTSIKTIGSGYAFMGLNYVTAIVCLILGKIPLYTDVNLLCCLDIGCGVIFVDRTQLLKKALTEKILKIATLLKVRGIGSSKYKSDKFISMSLYFPSIDSTNHPAYAHIQQVLHIVKESKANLLVGNDILAMKKVIIDLANKSVMISSYQVTISITAKLKDHLVQRKVLVDSSLTIFPESEALVQFVCSSFPDDRDFLFNLTPHSHFTLFSHILNNSTCRVPVRNVLHKPVLLPCCQQLDMLIKVLYDNCFQVSLNPKLAEHSPITSNHQAGIRVPTLKSGFKTCLANRTESTGSFGLFKRSQIL